MGLSRNAVRKVIRSGQAEVPALEREELLTDSLELVRALHDDCRGNLVRVSEKLADAGIHVGYSTLTSFCRRHEIGTAPKQAFGAYHFAPGEEMRPRSPGDSRKTRFRLLARLCRAGFDPQGSYARFQ